MSDKPSARIREDPSPRRTPATPTRGAGLGRHARLAPTFVAVFVALAVAGCSTSPPPPGETNPPSPAESFRPELVGEVVRWDGFCGLTRLWLKDGSTIDLRLELSYHDGPPGDNEASCSAETPRETVRSLSLGPDQRDEPWRPRDAGSEFTQPIALVLYGHSAEGAWYAIAPRQRASSEFAPRQGACEYAMEADGAWDEGPNLHYVNGLVLPKSAAMLATPGSADRLPAGRTVTCLDPAGEVESVKSIVLPG